MRSPPKLSHPLLLFLQHSQLYLSIIISSLTSLVFSPLPILSYIYSHYSEPISLDEIAAAGKVCRNKCCQIFRRYLCQSPIDFLNHYRLEVSCHLLNTTKMSIAEICTACGFNHQSYYSKIFLRTYHCTPRDFRKPAEGLPT